MRDLLIPLKTQFFAESDSTGADNAGSREDTSKEGKGQEEKEQQLPLEEQLQQMKVELAKYKKATDKATSEAAEYKKQLRAKQSADEVAAQEKAEEEATREEQFQQLLKENTVTKYEKNYLTLGYPQDLATKAATAQYDNDTEELFKIQKDFQTLFVKQKEAEWLKTRPTVTVGVGEDDNYTMSKEDIEKMDYSELVKLKAGHPKVYEKYFK